MPAWRLSAVSVFAPAFLLMGLDLEASSGGVEVASVLEGGVLAAGSGLGLESLVQLIGMLFLVLGLFAAFAWEIVTPVAWRPKSPANPRSQIPWPAQLPHGGRLWGTSVFNRDKQRWTQTDQPTAGGRKLQQPRGR